MANPQTVAVVPQAFFDTLAATMLGTQNGAQTVGQQLQDIETRATPADVHVTVTVPDTFGGNGR